MKSNGFEHSVKVPRFYKITAKTVQNVEEEGASLKQLVYEKKHPNIRGVYGLAATTIEHGPQIDYLLRKTQLLVKEPRIDVWLARVLINELLWGKQKISIDRERSVCRPIETILKYEEVLRDELKNISKADIDGAATKKVKRPRYIRVNTLSTTVRESIRSFQDDGWKLLPKSQDYSAFLEVLSSLAGDSFVQDFHIPELFAFPPGTEFHDHPGYRVGALVMQDKASCLPAYLLNPTPGSNVLDMCAAPGMKTLHLAAIMKNEGTVFAIEKDGRRFQTLCELVNRNKGYCVKKVCADAMTQDPITCPDVEYILVDPSCSGSGMLDRGNLRDASSKSAPGRLISLQSFQVLLLRHALLSFPKVKRVVYSTCSIYPEENEMVVDEILSNIGDAYKLVPAKNLLSGTWKNFSSTEYECKDNCLYARPEVDLSNGFFVAVFERNFDVPLPKYQRKNPLSKRKYNKDIKKESNGASDEPKTKKIKVEINATDAQDGEKLSKKRQKKKIKSEISESPKVQSAINGDGAQVKKMKKKKSTFKVTEEVERSVAPEKALTVGERKIKNKKKTKNLQSKEINLKNKDSAVSTAQEKKMKMKKKNKRAELDTSGDASKSTINEKPKEKKKNKKKKEKKGGNTSGRFLTL